MASDRELNEQKLRDSLKTITDAPIDSALVGQIIALSQAILLDTDKGDKESIRTDIRAILDTPQSYDDLVQKLQDFTSTLMKKAP